MRQEVIEGGAEVQCPADLTSLFGLGEVISRKRLKAEERVQRGAALFDQEVGRGNWEGRIRSAVFAGVFTINSYDCCAAALALDDGYRECIERLGLSESEQYSHGFVSSSRVPLGVLEACWVSFVMMRVYQA